MARLRVMVGKLTLAVLLASLATPAFAHGGSGGDDVTYAQAIPYEHDVHSL